MSKQGRTSSFLRPPPATSMMPAVAEETTPASENQTWVIRGPDRPELRVFDQLMINYILPRRITAAALAITHDSRLVYARGFTYGVDEEDPRPVQPTSLFRIAGVSMPITATAVLRLFQDLQLPLSERVQDILALKPPQGEILDPALADVTVLNLLQHLGGWDRSITFDPMFSDSKIAEALGVSLPVSRTHIATYMAGQPLQHVPGTQYAYSNYGYSLLGLVIEALTGMSYQHYVSRAVFHPLGITRPILGRSLEVQRLAGEVKYHTQSSGSSVTDNCGASVTRCYGGFNLENMDSHGGWLASAVDLVRFASTFDSPDASPVLNSASVERMFDLPENLPQSLYTDGDDYYGCGWSVNWFDEEGERRLHAIHSGSLPGTKADLVRHYKGVNWCVLLNQRDDPSGLDYSIPSTSGPMHEAITSVSTWPDEDLFAEHL